ncbi:MAG: hypothetical protein JST22_08135 [Bacteroidetes bacterium]|nr:hypothetical protein [Bacteroidota bacterium]
MLIRKFLLLALLLGIPAVASAQSPISFDSLARVIDPYFAPELVKDIKDALPQASYDIWGYDVGDYTGDGANDFALAIRAKNDTRKRMTVYMFVDDEGMLRLVKQTPVDFIELPIEVGVAISQGNVYMTRKVKEFNWEILGYRYRDGVMMMVDKFSTMQQGNMTYENYRNFQTLEGYERYINSADTNVVFRSDFLTTPCYNRGRDVSSGYQATARAAMTRYITRGSYYWGGEGDLSLNVRSAYDKDYLYFNISVRDDEVIPVGVNNVDTAADRLELWLDMYSLGDRFRAGRRARDFRMKTDSNIYAMTIALGDFVDQQPRVRLSSSNNMDEVQRNAAKTIKAVAARTDSGYTVKLRIPFLLFGFNGVPIEDNDPVQFGMNVVVHDVDNPYRPEQVTTMTTSQDFDRSKPATFGGIVLLPNTSFYGESTNIFLGDLKERLNEVGY